MKEKVFFILGVMIPSVLLAQPEVQLNKATINGSLISIKPRVSKLYYSYLSANDISIQDSVKVVNNKYSITDIATEAPVILTLTSVSPQSSQRATEKEITSVFLKPGANTVVSTGALSNTIVKGSEVHADMVKLDKAILAYLVEINTQSERFFKLREKKDTAGMRKIEQELLPELQNKMLKTYVDYIEKNPSSPVAGYAVIQYAKYCKNDPALVEPLFNTLSAEVKNSDMGKVLTKRLAIAKLTAVGSMAPEFSQADTAGKMVTLASFRGKYVLLDFWASWCGPCRAENPNVMAAFNKYKDRNFTVLSVSLDGNRDKWLAAIAKDKLTWIQVSDLKGWENAVAKQYNILGIPQSFLIDPSGKIVAKNLRGKQLEQKLEELIR